MEAESANKDWFLPLDYGFGEILNIDNLWRCQVVIDWCCICKRDEDTIIYLYIALSLESCGIWCFHYLRFIGLCRMMLWSFLLAG